MGCIGEQRSVNFNLLSVMAGDKKGCLSKPFLFALFHAAVSNTATHGLKADDDINVFLDCRLYQRLLYKNSKTE